MEQYKEVNGISYTLVGGLLPAESAAASGGGKTRWRVGPAADGVPEAAPKRHVLTSADQRRTQRPLGRHGRAGKGDVFPSGGADGSQRGRHGGTESQGPDGLGGPDEQHRRPRPGDHIRRSDMRMKRGRHRRASLKVFMKRILRTFNIYWI